MQKTDFEQDTKYTATVKDEHGKSRPMNFYVLKLHNDFMIVRKTDKDSALYKVLYSNVEKIVKVIPVAPQNRWTIPQTLLSDKHWKDRTVIAHYSSIPHSGK